MEDLRPEPLPNSIAAFLGRVEPNGRGQPKLKDRMALASQRMTAAHDIWKRRCINRNAEDTPDKEPNPGN